MLIEYGIEPSLNDKVPVTLASPFPIQTVPGATLSANPFPYRFSALQIRRQFNNGAHEAMTSVSEGRFRFTGQVGTGADAVRIGLGTAPETVPAPYIVVPLPYRPVRVYARYYYDSSALSSTSNLRFFVLGGVVDSDHAILRRPQYLYLTNASTMTLQGHLAPSNTNFNIITGLIDVTAEGFTFGNGRAQILDFPIELPESYLELRSSGHSIVIWFGLQNTDSVPITNIEICGVVMAY